MKNCWPIVKIMASLTKKQQAFVDEYIKDKNATRAAKAAGYSEKNADKIGSELLGKTRVSQAIREKLGEVAQECKRTATDWLNDVLTIKQQAIQDGNLKDALKALDMEGKYLGIYTEKNETVLSGGLEVTWLK